MDEHLTNYRIIFKDKDNNTIPSSDPVYKNVFDNIYRNLEKFEIQKPDSFEFKNGRDDDGYYFIQISKLDSAYADSMIKHFNDSSNIPEMAKSYITDILLHAKKFLNT